MLCITRFIDEKLIISDRATGAILATIMVVDILHGPKVRLGADADQSICVDRPEIYQKRRDEQRHLTAIREREVKGAVE